MRILRGLRFASTLGFVIEEETARAIHQLTVSFRQVSVERITTELRRLILGEAVSNILCEYADVIAVFLPELQGNLSRNRLSALPADLILRLAALFYDAEISAANADGVLRRLRWDNQTIRGVTQLLSVDVPAPCSGDGYLLRLLHRLGPELIWHYYRLKETDVELVERTQELLSLNACYKISMLAINGSDLVALEVAPGPAIGALLQELLYAVMDGQCDNTPEALMEYINQHKKPVQ